MTPPNPAGEELKECISKDCNFTVLDGGALCSVCSTELSAELMIVCPECSKHLESMPDLADHWDEVHRGEKDFTEVLESEQS